MISFLSVYVCEKKIPRKIVLLYFLELVEDIEITVVL